jgi:septal ring factor EnvC (AmiA/AmiB activator)
MIEREGRKAEELKEVRARSAEILRSTREDQESHRRAIAELARAASALEKAIVAGSEESTNPATIDIVALKGAISWPVSGMIDVPFGDIKHPRFKTVTPHPGLDIRTEAAAPIRAVLGGRVVFSRRFSGYGNTVIIDHGGKYLTVYARAAVLKVAEGDEVLTGQVLGLSGDRAFDGGPPTVYFEIRHEGRALDPAAWLKRNHGSGGEG